MKTKLFFLWFLIGMMMPQIASAESGKCGDNLTWTLENGVLTISGTGAMSNYHYEYDMYWGISLYSKEAAPWWLSNFHSIVIKDGVTSIGENAFLRRSESKLKSITIPKSIEEIGYDAFGVISKGENSGGNTIDEISSRERQQVDYLYSDSEILFSKRYFYADTVVIGNSVTNIGENAFSDCSRLKSLTIGNSVANIGKNAFSGCSSLESLTIPSSVTSIAEGAFSGCSRLESLTIPSSVTSIGKNAFENVYIYKRKFTNNSTCRDNDCWGITLCDEETKEGLLIKDNVATKCRLWATSVTIPNSVTSIGENAFGGCSSLTSVTIPNSVTRIGYDAFYNCSGLTSVDISDLSSWCNIDFGGGYANPTYYAHKLVLNGTEIKDLVIPSGITAVKKHAFAGCSGLTSITIPNSVTSIGNYAFYRCSDLTSITIPNSVTSIGESAFFGCSNVSELVYAEGCTTALPTYLTSITSVTIPNSVTSIGNFAFWNCYGLTSITIPNSVTSIGFWAFYGCSGLTSVTIGNSVTSIGDKAFDGCTSVEYLNVDINSVCLKDIFGTNLKEVVIGNSVTSIGDYAFNDCKKLASVIIGNSVTNIGKSSFSGCEELAYASFGRSVTSIGEDAFRNCKNLTSITIPSSLTNIGSGAFNGADNISEIYSLAIVPPSCASENVFSADIYETAMVYVPNTNNALMRYLGAEVWKKFYNMQEKDMSGISAPTIDHIPSTQSYYNLQGQKSTTPPRGLYIQNGRKILKH